MLYTTYYCCTCRHNSRAGGWGEWGAWGDCSRTCGAGVAFRTRRCDSPRPAYGGRACVGNREEFRLCSLDDCTIDWGEDRDDDDDDDEEEEEEEEQGSDFRAEQCDNLFEMVVLGGAAPIVREEGQQEEASGPPPPLSQSRRRQRWFPYEHSNRDLKCKLTCYSRRTGEHYQTGENVVDGTPCSYDDAAPNICVQGKCIKMGCDKVLLY